MATWRGQILLEITSASWRRRGAVLDFISFPCENLTLKAGRMRKLVAGRMPA